MAESLFVVIPTETIKTKIVHSNMLPTSPFPTSSKNSLAATRTLAQQGGLRSIYSGVSATLLRQGFSSMVRFGTYSTLKNLVQGSTRPGQKLPSGVTFGIGALAGMATVCECKRLQRQSPSDKYDPTHTYTPSLVLACSQHDANRVRIQECLLRRAC